MAEKTVKALAIFLLIASMTFSCCIGGGEKPVPVQPTVSTLPETVPSTESEVSSTEIAALDTSLSEPATVETIAYDTTTYYEPATTETVTYETTTLNEPPETVGEPTTYTDTLVSTTYSTTPMSYVPEGTTPGPLSNTLKMEYAADQAPADATRIYVSNIGYDSGYGVYGLKLNAFIYSAEDVVGGVLLDVKKPDGTVVQARMGYDACHKTYYDAQIGDMVLRFKSASEEAQYQAAEIYAWDYRNTPVIKERILTAPDARAVLLKDVTSEGFTEYKGYGFKVERIDYSDVYHPFLIVLQVRTPDMKTKELSVKEGSNYRLDNLNIAAPFCGTAADYGVYYSVYLWVWEGQDTTVDTTPPEELYPLTYTPDKPPKGATPLDLSDNAYSAQYKGYKFMIKSLVYGEEYKCSAVLIYVQRPDGNAVEQMIGYDPCHGTYYDAQVDDVVLRLISSHGESPSPGAWEQKARLYAWDYKDTPVIKKQIPPQKPDPGAKLLDIYTGHYVEPVKGYNFKLESLESSGDYHVSTINLQVRKPDGTTENAKITEGATTEVGNLKLSSPFCGTAIDVGPEGQQAQIWVWEK